MLGYFHVLGYRSPGAAAQPTQANPSPNPSPNTNPSPSPSPKQVLRRNLSFAFIVEDDAALSVPASRSLRPRGLLHVLDRLVSNPHPNPKPKRPTQP